MNECKAVGYRIEAGGLWGNVAISCNVGTVNDLGKPIERRILELIFDDDRFEAAAAVDVPQLDSLEVIRSDVLALGDGHNLLGGHVEELRIGIDEFLDQPRASNPVDVGILASPTSWSAL